MALGIGNLSSFRFDLAEHSLRRLETRIYAGDACHRKRYGIISSGGAQDVIRVISTGLARPETFDFAVTSCYAWSGERICGCRILCRVRTMYGTMENARFKNGVSAVILAGCCSAVLLNFAMTDVIATDEDNQAIRATLQRYFDGIIQYVEPAP